ncbi:MAG: aspartate/glutamate racemase family protein [Pyrinomonadaceae bacterium]
MKIIGLIGGMSWESSVVYYQIINRKTQELLGGSHSAESVMYSVDFGEIARLQHEANWAELEKIMIDAAKRLERGGAELIVICTNTMHMFADEMESVVSIPLVHIGDAAGEAIRKSGLTKVGLLGTRFTMEKDFLKKRLLDKFGIETIIPDEADREIVHSIIYNELVKGEIKSSSRETYLTIANKLTSNGAEGIILGCTEIPLLITPEFTDTILFDTTRIHAEMAVAVALQ